MKTLFQQTKTKWNGRYIDVYVFSEPWIRNCLDKETWDIYVTCTLTVDGYSFCGNSSEKGISGTLESIDKNIEEFIPFLIKDAISDMENNEIVSINCGKEIEVIERELRLAIGKQKVANWIVKTFLI